MHVAAALQAVADRGSGAAAIHVDGSCALGVVVRATTPEDLGVPQPVVDPPTNTALVFDGRLDDRCGLVDSLRGAAVPVDLTRSDAQLVLAAYLRWGRGCLARLIGEFAFAVWDPRQRCLTCARDVLGLRPLYYAVGRDYFFFGSNPRSVLAQPVVPRRPNLGMVGEFVSLALCNREETLYSDVRRLPPAHYIQIGTGAPAMAPYWDLDPGHHIRYRNPGDYEEHFRALMRRAVGDRLRCIGPIGLALSGGIDSSAVAGVTQQLLDEEGAGTRLRAYSNTYPDASGVGTGYVSDETPYIDAVVERWGLISRRFPWRRFESVPWEQQARTGLDIPDYPNAAPMAALFRGALEDGVRVILTGQGGDSWHQGSQLPHRELLQARDLTGLASELRYRADAVGWPNAVRMLFGSLGWGLIPGGIRRWIEGRRRHLPLPPYLPSRFVRAIALAERVRCDDCADRFRYASRWQMVKHGRSGVVLHGMEVMERSVAERGLELRHPLLDRRLIEFAVGIPDQVKRRGATDRYTMRRAMFGLYPELVRGREDKSAFDFLFVHALLLPDVQRVLASPLLLERPWVQPDLYRRFLAQTLADCRSDRTPAPRPLFYLWMLYAVEVWHRAVFGQ